MLAIAIIGRPNVGKSTLFNRLAGKRLAIVDDRPGVTRDWREAEGYLLDQPVRIIDTAGLEETFDESIEGKMRQQTEAAMSKADALLFLIDGRAGVTPMDEYFARWLRKKKKPVVLAVNKCENEKATQSAVGEAHKLGFGAPIPISSAHGEGIEDLYFAFQPYFEEPVAPDADAAAPEREEQINDAAFDVIEGDMDYELAAPEDAEEEKFIKIAIAGRPNVGKSTLLNALLEDNRVMTSPEAGTTRDAIAVDWEYGGKENPSCRHSRPSQKSAGDRTISRKWPWKTRFAPFVWRRWSFWSSMPTHRLKNRICRLPITFWMKDVPW
jgi:GTP-binding protein